MFVGGVVREAGGEEVWDRDSAWGWRLGVDICGSSSAYIMRAKKKEKKGGLAKK